MLCITLKGDSCYRGRTVLREEKALTNHLGDMDPEGLWHLELAAIGHPWHKATGSNNVDKI